MATQTDWICVLLSRATLLLFFVDSVYSYYCDNDKCTEEEYCCGDNMCCPSYKVWDLWYFWCGVLFFMFLLSLCACLWRNRFLTNGPVIISSYSYTPLQEVDSIGSLSRYHPSNQLYTAPLGTPPPYNQISAGNVKNCSPLPTYAQVVGVSH
ncbi:uncharacterized protein LOC106058541 [Biomphalaria glabrata]|uniref:WW domain binding protein VOPP1 n=1 Tax=Biomphalaria glabrata TaxID=6526 RepID=A0A9W3BLC8_BIOGL|nr:uncharacterized protein LOC106058541 [Biomphalaria glabrata]KAI8789734.1 vesicular, overexpressed in cancer, prosurvival protein 1 [Biomphalaria glabrata]